MYSPEINFLKDRPDLRDEPVPVQRRAMPTGIMPLILGIVTGAIVPLAVLFAWGLLQFQNQKLQTQEEELDAELGQMASQMGKVQQIRERAQQVQNETTALAQVFARVRPWSAILQDIQDLTPESVQVNNVQQMGGEAKRQVEVAGAAGSYTSVNDFVLTLEQSPLFESESVALLSTELRPNPLQVEVRDPTAPAESPGGQAGQQPKYDVQLPQVVAYRIRATLSDTSAFELVRYLESKGAVGVATRIEALRKLGIVQP